MPGIMIVSQFQYRGKGEAPVNEVNYRPFKKGGLVVQSAEYKTMALLYKNAIRLGNDDEHVDQRILNRLRLEGLKDTKEI